MPMLICGISKTSIVGLLFSHFVMEWARKTVHPSAMLGMLNLNILPSDSI